MTHQRASARLDPGTARPFRGFKIDGVAAPSRGAGTLFLPPGPTIKQAGLLSRTTRLTAGALSPANVLCLRGTLPGVAQPGSRAVAPRFISVRCPFRRCVHVSPARSCSPYRPLGLFGDAWTWLLLCVCAAAGQVMERTIVGRYVSAQLLTMLAAMAMAASGLLPISAPAYEVVWSMFLPLASVLFMLDTRLQKLGPAESATLKAFVAGAFGTMLGTVVAWVVIGKHLGAEGWKLAGALCATYIGGSINFAATAKALDLGDGVSAAMAADNIAMAVYLAAISAIPVKAMAWGNQEPSRAPDPPFEGTDDDVEGNTALSICTAAAICCLGSFLASWAGLKAFSIVLSSLMASGLSAIVSSLKGAPRFSGGQKIGSTILLFFFATIGAAAGSLQDLAGSWRVLLFILIQLVVHLAVCLGFQAATCLPMEAVLTASNANVGGPGTAAAMAVGRGWPSMVRPALLTGSLGYAAGTVIGVGVAQLLQQLM